MTENDCPMYEEDRMTVKSGLEDSDSSGKGRVLYCRKCEGHGQQVILKGHAPICPYILCQCASCEKLMNKRLKSFNKRNREKIQLATQMAHKRGEHDRDSGRGSSSTPSSGTCSPDTVMSMCNGHQPSSSKAPSGLESRSMSMGAMTVMSYDIWKAKCAAERKEREERDREDKERKASLPVCRQASPEVQQRKRAHTFVSSTDAQLPRIKLNGEKEQKKGRYVTLPTIPPMSVLIADEDAPELTPTEIVEVEKKEEAPVLKPIPAPVARKLGANVLPPASLFQSLNLPTSTVTPMTVPTVSLPFSLPTSLPPTTLPADQILASMIPQSMIPSSVLLQSSLLLNQATQAAAQLPQQQNLMQAILSGDMSALISSLSQPQPNILELLQRSAQLQQLTASLSALSPPTASPPLDTNQAIASLSNPLFTQLMTRQPLFTSTI